MWKTLRYGVVSIFNVIIENPLLLIMFGLVQLSLFQRWPNEYWHDAFPYYHIPHDKNNPHGTIHAHSYGAYFHTYIMFLCFFVFGLIATKYRWQFIFFIFFEFCDIVDFMLRYNQKIFELTLYPWTWEITYTDFKKALYGIVIATTTWKHKQSSEQFSSRL
jgi:hypothetical protein